MKEKTWRQLKIGQYIKFDKFDVTNQLLTAVIHAFIMSRLNYYCNSMFYGLSDNQLNKLQEIQNSAARMLFRQRKHEHITPLLNSLHWLPIKYCLEVKTDHLQNLFM